MEEKGVEHWVEERQRKRARKEEEAQKRRRTVFVGNLPISCTKKVGRGDPSSMVEDSSSIRGSDVDAATFALPQMLHNLFREAGAVESIRFRSVVKT